MSSLDHYRAKAEELKAKSQNEDSAISKAVFGGLPKVMCGWLASKKIINGKSGKRPGRIPSARPAGLASADTRFHCPNARYGRSSLTRWRQRMGEEKIKALLQESLSIAVKTEAIKPSELSEVMIDTTVEPRNATSRRRQAAQPGARDPGAAGRKHGAPLRQSYARVGKFALIRHRRYAHAKQFKRANRASNTLRTYLVGVIRDIGRKIEHDGWLKEMSCESILLRARRVRDQQQRQRGRRSIPCTPRRWSALAKARPIVLTSSASKSPWRRRIATQGRTVRHPCGGATGQSARRPDAGDRDPGHGGARRQHSQTRLRGQGLPRPQCATRL